MLAPPLLKTSPTIDDPAAEGDPGRTERMGVPNVWSQAGRICSGGPSGRLVHGPAGDGGGRWLPDSAQLRTSAGRKRRHLEGSVRRGVRAGCPEVLPPD